LIGGVLVEALGWRSVFLLNLPVIGVAGPLAAVVLRPDRGTDRGALDLAGVELGAAALCSLTFASIEAGRAGLSAPVVAAAVIGLGFGALFIATELRVSRPILPPALLRRPRFAVANAVATSMNLGTLGTLFVLTLYLQSVRGDSALVAGLGSRCSRRSPCWRPTPVAWWARSDPGDR
jgi:DHA2 family methylenomycin A resistance protein-like MFS transporter